MKKSLKFSLRLLSLALLLTLCLTAVAGCEGPDVIGGETTATPETEAPSNTLVLDTTYVIVIPDDADAITEKAATLVAATLGGVLGEIPTVTTASVNTSSRAIHLGLATFDGERCYDLAVEDSALRLNASDSTTLYYATEAVLNTWMTMDSALEQSGKLSLDKSRVSELNGLTTKLDTSIKVITQNVRGFDDPDGNTIQKRSVRFQQLLEEYRPDLIGTQEYNLTWNINWNKMAGKEGSICAEYGMVGCSREGRDTKSGEFNVIFYRLDRFELLDSDTTWLSDTPDRPSAVENSLCRRICTWALLKDKLTGETILYANTHLDHSTDEVRSAQATILMDYLAERIGEYPFYLTGDFNCYVNSLPYTTVTDRLQDSHKTAWTDESTVTRTYHGYTEYGGGEIDFVFHNDKTTAVNYEIISTSYGGVVSDHFGVYVEFVND